MRLNRIFLTILILFVFNSFASNNKNLCNDYICASIISDSNHSDFGALSAIRSTDNKSSISDISFFTLKCGAVGASEKKLIFSGEDSLSLRLSGFGKYPLSALVNYKLVDEVLRVSLKLWVERTTEFDSGLSLVCEDPQLTLNNVKTGVVGFKPVNHNLSSGSKFRSHLDNYADFYGVNSKCSDTLIHIVCSMINPFHSYWEFNSNRSGSHRLDILPILPSNSTSVAQSFRGPPAVSTLLPYDTIYRDVTISLSNTSGPSVSFSEHINGFAPAVTMFWDELPNRDNWNFMTSSDARNVAYDHFWVRLLNSHPGLKMGYLLMLDRMLFRDRTAFANWNINSLYIIADSLDEYEGQYCANFRAKDTTLRISQYVPCKPLTKYTMYYRMKTENITGAGAYGEVYSKSKDSLISDSLITAGPQTTGSVDWMQYELPFSTEADDTLLKVFLRIQSGSGSAYFDDIRLICNNGTTDESINLIRNPGFEENEPAYIFDNKRRHWADASGLESIISKAPESYRNFLKRIDKMEKVHGWENRIHLGCHGYHHTPSIFELDKPGPGWEFQYYDTTGDRLRFEKIFSGIEKVGLSRMSLKFMRPPGCMFTSSLVNILADSGFVYLGINTLPEFFCLPVQREKNRLWVNSSVFWADFDQNNNTVPLHSVLEGGHLAQIGGHPETVFLNSTENSYKRMDALFNGIESKYSNAGYVFPDEYADNANAVYSLNNCVQVNDGFNSHLYFRGAVKAGVSVVLHGTCSNVSLDNRPVALKQVGNLCYVVLPSAPDIMHTLSFDNISFNQSREINRSEHVIVNKIIQDHNIYKIITPDQSVIKTEVLKLNGKMIFSEEVLSGKNRQYVFNMNNIKIANGVYLVKFSINGKQLSSRKISYCRF